MKSFLPWGVCNIISQRDMDVNEHLPQENEPLNKGEDSPPGGEGGVLAKHRSGRKRPLALRPVSLGQVKCNCEHFDM